VSGAASGLAGLLRARAPGSAGLRAATLTGRVAVLPVLGFLTFEAPWPGRTNAVAQIAAFAVAAVVVVWYSVAEVRAGSRRRDVFLMPGGLGTVAVTCGAASMTPRGEPLILLACLAVLLAGTGTSQAGGWSVAALAVIGV
jgi:hypothetical protein